MPHFHAKLLASSRQHSEDRAETFECGSELLVVVADGAGGLGGGAAAAGAIVRIVHDGVMDPASDMHDADGRVRALEAADARLAQMGGETTGVLVVVGHDGLIGVSAGDSEAWLVTASLVDDLTGTQSRARLGSGRAAPVSFRRPLIEGTLVIATDGLFRYASADAIVAAVRTAVDVDSAARHLASLVRMPSGAYQDDVALVVVRLGGRSG
jgi:serine/threonine protein phosphatase PrpC